MDLCQVQPTLVGSLVIGCPRFGTEGVCWRRKQNDCVWECVCEKPRVRMRAIGEREEATKKSFIYISCMEPGEGVQRKTTKR